MHREPLFNIGIPRCCCPPSFRFGINSKGCPWQNGRGIFFENGIQFSGLGKIDINSYTQTTGNFCLLSGLCIQHTRNKEKRDRRE